MKITTARLAAIAATATVVLFGATTATAGGSPTIPDGSVWQADMAKPVNDLYLKDLGKGSVVKTINDGRIGRIRGDSYTLLTTFDMPAGTWLITINATFGRTVSAPAGATKTRPTLTLRYVEGVEVDARDAGTIKGVDISPIAGIDLAGATVRTVTLRGAHTPFTLYGSGQNDDESTFATAQITVAAQITATRIG